MPIRQGSGDPPGNVASECEPLVFQGDKAGGFEKAKKAEIIFTRDSIPDRGRSSFSSGNAVLKGEEGLECRGAEWMVAFW